MKVWVDPKETTAEAWVGAAALVLPEQLGCLGHVEVAVLTECEGLVVLLLGDQLVGLERKDSAREC